MLEPRDENQPFWNRWEAQRVLRKLQGCQRRDHWRENWPRIQAEREALASGKLVRFEPRRFRRWSEKRIRARLHEIDALDNTPMPQMEVLDIVVEQFELEDELRARGLSHP